MAKSRTLGTGQFRLRILCFFIGRSASGYGGESGALGEGAGPLANNPRATKISTNGGWKYSCVRALVRLRSRKNTMYKKISHPRGSPLRARLSANVRVPRQNAKRMVSPTAPVLTSSSRYPLWADARPETAVDASSEM